METEKRLIDQLREMADRTPPICQYDKPEKTMIFGKEITVYCKPFEQFQELLRRAADALDVDAVEVVHGMWEPHPNYPGFDRCAVCHDCIVYDDWVDGIKWRYCPNCGAKMDGVSDG